MLFTITILIKKEIRICDVSLIVLTLVVTGHRGPAGV